MSLEALAGTWVLLVLVPSFPIPHTSTPLSVTFKTPDRYSDLSTVFLLILRSKDPTLT